MDIRFVQRGAEIDEKLREYMEKKISRLEKFFKKILNCQIVVTHHKGTFNVETTANANGVILRAEEEASEPRKAFDQSLKNLERRIKKYNSYLKDRAQLGAGEEFSFSLDEAADADSPVPLIDKVKKVEVRPMEISEAAAQMELIGHTFFMFQNVETGDINVIYKRGEDSYGLLEPVK
ncbi:MAG: ribosome-associated translation inhibitor RaiA [Synergistales bacterium]|nr:ribosome-associated translation inhibitor RaiA [Synergistales bacterium]MDY6400810.1 ribosome-associated translation inhibitor RaiA [Synergistales bacterium]MDY6403998.1 ribosome-associated translation inhibitor RaiA [Synergistales bacterium]MDY6410465.1 ribosome-associated translation inhibitor RaiA [Synergistales bacterium]MDY6414603.1 ribosome-associated translation inhibitor RaiA [Synergistales bacterium]